MKEWIPYIHIFLLFLLIQHLTLYLDSNKVETIEFDSFVSLLLFPIFKKQKSIFFFKKNPYLLRIIK